MPVSSSQEMEVIISALATCIQIISCMHVHGMINPKGGVLIWKGRAAFSPFLFTQKQVTTCSVMEVTERETDLMLEESCDPSFC